MIHGLTLSTVTFLYMHLAHEDVIPVNAYVSRNRFGRLY